MNPTAHVIHLPKRGDRLSHFIKEASEQEIQFILHEGIIGKQYPYIGIRESHQSIVRWALSQNLEEVLIMEDDVSFVAPNAFKYFIDHKPKDFDIYLSSIYHGYLDPKADEKIVDDFCGLHCYIVHKRFFWKFLNVAGMNHMDRGLAGLGKFVVCNPFVCVQRNGFSDNKQMMATYDHLMEGRDFLK